MATVIDTLVVELGLDPAKFTQGQKDALAAFKKTREEAIASGKDIEAQGKKINEFFGTLKREALGLTALFLGGKGIKEFVGYVTNLDASTGRLAKTLNMSTAELSTWMGVAQVTGGTTESMASALHGLSSEVNKFLLTGQGAFLPLFNTLNISLYDGNKNLKTAGQLFMEINKAIQGMDPARASALLSMIPGMNQQTVNTLILGEKTLQKLLVEQKSLSSITEQNARDAQALQKSWVELEQSSTSFGRSVLELVTPTIKGVLFLMRQVSDVFNSMRKTRTPEEQAAADKQGDNLHKDLRKKFGKPTGFFKWLQDWVGGGEDDAEAAPSSAPAPSTTGGAFKTQAEKEAFIRAEAAKRGINPDVAMAVAKSEGFNTYVGDKGTSFGAFQLHYKNNIPGLSNGGLGDVFTKKTGLHASDPGTEKEQIQFALDEAKKSGWGPWHGWKGLPYAGIGNVGAGAAAAAGGRGGDTKTSSTTTTIGQVTINTQATDAAGIARDIGPALERSSFAASANYGQQ